MLKNILNLNGAQELSKNEQKTIQGAGGSRMLCIDQCQGGGPCPSGSSCVIFGCFPWHDQPFSSTYGLCIGGGGNEK